MKRKSKRWCVWLEGRTPKPQLHAIFCGPFARFSAYTYIRSDVGRALRVMRNWWIRPEGTTPRIKETR